MPRIVHFDIPSDNPERAQKFYSQVFGWKFDKWNGPMEYWMVNTGDDKQPGINGGLGKRMPGQFGMNRCFLRRRIRKKDPVKWWSGRCSQNGNPWSWLFYTMQRYRGKRIWHYTNGPERKIELFPKLEDQSY